MGQYRYSIISVDTKNYSNIELESDNYLRVKKEYVTTVFGKLNIPDKDNYIELYISKITHIKTKSISGLVYFIIDHELIYERESFFTCPGFAVRWVGDNLDDDKKN